MEFLNVRFTINLKLNPNLFYRLLGFNRDEILVFENYSSNSNPQPQTRTIHHNYSFGCSSR